MNVTLLVNLLTEYMRDAMTDQGPSDDVGGGVFTCEPEAGRF